MKNLMVSFVLGITLILIYTSCGKNDDENNSEETLIELLDMISTDQYYTIDSLEILYPAINGIWKAKTAEDQFGIEYPPSFDYLLIKPNSVFGIVRDDILLLHGKIRIEGQFDNRVIFEEVNSTTEDLAHFINSGFVDCIEINDESMIISTCTALSGHKTKLERDE